MEFSEKKKKYSTIMAFYLFEEVIYKNEIKENTSQEVFYERSSSLCLYYLD